jgi:polyhydroxyalkanoate synthase
MMSDHLFRVSNPVRLLYEGADQVRRWQGRLLDMLGGGPVETRSRIVSTGTAMTLKAYSPARSGGPVVLLVPAPIKQAYIWDLAPRSSAVRRFLLGGVNPYLMQWEHPSYHEQAMGLDEYADRLVLDALDAAGDDSGRKKVFLAGHSLGGTFAAIFAALHPQRVKGLILLGSPVSFGKDASAFGPLISVSPPADCMTAMLGNVPGSFLDAVCHLASPATFETAPLLDRLESLGDMQALQTHLRVIRWMHDEMPLPGRLFEEVVELLYRRNLFMRGRLMVNDRCADPSSLEVPVLSVVDPDCVVAPPASVLPFHETHRNTDKRVIRYKGDTGTALRHVGMLVGKNAHRFLWPEIVRWVHAHADR